MKWSEIDCPGRVYGQLDENEKAARGYFLNSIGIDLEDIPEELFEPCVLYSSVGKQYSKEYEAKVHIRDIVGTKHTVYGGKNWICAFLEEHKVKDHIMCGHTTRGKYFRQLKKHTHVNEPCVRLIMGKDGKYYVSGNGNHRVTFYKMMYFADAANKKKNLHLYWLYARVQNEV